MSFGFGVGDFIAVGELCWKIYTRVYKVSRDAPEELSSLIQELGNLSNIMTLLNEELRDREEWIKRAGDRRLEYTCKVMGQAKETLEKMDRLADKYAELDSGVNSQGSKRSLRIQWNRIKYALEVSTINELRAKFISHNLHLSLLLQGAQNSSLERIEKQQTKTDTKLEELRNVMIGDRRSRETPVLRGPLDEEVLAELSAAFLRSAETGNRPWASIGIDDWLRAGKWWLLKARSQINHLAQGSGVEAQAYINLLKACWILTEIVSIHPQRSHLGASNDRRNEDIRNLSQLAKTSLESFPGCGFELKDVEDCTTNVWHTAPSSAIAPRRQFSANRDSPSWETLDGEVLFQCFVETNIKSENDPMECFLMLEVPRQGIYLNIILQNFAGQDICKLKVEPDDWSFHDSTTGGHVWRHLGYRLEKLGIAVRLSNAQDSDALQAILWGFQLFQSAFQPASLSISMIHSVSVLASWPRLDWSCLLLPGYDLGCPARSDSLALVLRTIINDLAEKGYQDKCRSSELFDKDCLDGKLSLGTFTWKIICWHCKTFADIKSLLEEFNVKEHLRDFLVQTSFLRLDRDFLSQMVQYLNYEDGWHPHGIIVMVEAALSSDDVGYLSLILEKVAASVLSENQAAIFQLVNRSRRLDHIDAMTQVIVTRPTSIAAILAWFLGSSDEQGFRDFLHVVKGRVGSFSSKTADEVDFSYFYPAFVAGCARLIETQSPNTLNLYLDTLEGLGIDFHIIEGRKNTESSQLAVLPALVSPDPAFLRILLEREVVVPDMQPFILGYVSSIFMKSPPKIDFTQYPPPQMPHWPLYRAVILVCDTEFLELLCQYGASLQQESMGTEDQENKAQGIVDHFSQLSSLEDARLEHTDALLFYHILIHVGIKGVHSTYPRSDRFNATDNTTDCQETWRCMERLLYRDGHFSGCLGPCHRFYRYGWKGKPEMRLKLMSRYTEFPDLYPKHLRTQSNWDKWRKNALQILSKLM